MYWNDVSGSSHSQSSTVDQTYPMTQEVNPMEETCAEKM
jgi:hypothetical protein